MKGGDAGGTFPAADGGNAVEQRCIRTTVRQPVAADMAKRDGSTADRVEHCIARFGREAERPAQLRSSRHARVERRHHARCQSGIGWWHDLQRLCDQAGNARKGRQAFVSGGERHAGPLRPQQDRGGRGQAGDCDADDQAGVARRIEQRHGAGIGAHGNAVTLDALERAERRGIGEQKVAAVLQIAPRGVERGDQPPAIEAAGAQKCDDRDGADAEDQQRDSRSGPEQAPADRGQQQRERHANRGIPPPRLKTRGAGPKRDAWIGDHGDGRRSARVASHRSMANSPATARANHGHSARVGGVGADAPIPGV